ncbi:nuclear transport factor 2 family protein [Actinophytocola glycyrrhizae]|uniref:Nuclear transport factor 2 family protein n=1 Tax=Actinophytocola glycyrrhizae TaxID=2044873 RepID=A0ABV9S2S5_9PSEU
MINGNRDISPSTATTAAGVDHVRLSYEYLDAGEFDAYGSLLHEDMQVSGFWDLPAHGRAAAVARARGAAGPPGHHQVHRVVAGGDCVVAIGRYVVPATTAAPAPAAVEFADVFTLSGDALLLGQRRFRYRCDPAGA